MTGAPPSTFTVLGATGYIGSRLVAHLQAQGHSVWAPARGDAEVFTRPLGHVMYCVGLTADFRTRPFDTVDAHVGLLAEVLRRAQFDSLLYLSSTRVYMGGSSTQEDAPLTVCPAEPSHLYNLSKLTGESLCHASGRPGVRVVRLSNVVGPDMEPASGNFIASLLNSAHMGNILLQSNLESTKDYIHINDVVEGILLIALKGCFSVYNLASGKNITHREWMHWMARNFGCSFSVKLNAPVQYFPEIEVGRIEKEFGLRPQSALNFRTISITK